MINFRQYIREFRSPVSLGSEFSQQQLLVMLANEEVDILPNAIRIEGKDIIINCISVSHKDKCFVLTNREDREEVIGYLFAHNMYKDYWQTGDVCIFKKYTNQGIGTDFYVKLITSGFKLMNGFSLSAPMVKLWLEKLPKLVTVKVVNIETGEIEDFNEKPKLDTQPDMEQKWFYIAESSIKIETLRTDFLKISYLNSGSMEIVHRYAEVFTP